MAPTLDRLSGLLQRQRMRATLLHTGPLCGVTHFAGDRGHGYLHVLRRGETTVTHRPRAGAPQVVQLTEPALVFYPRPMEHAFHNAPQEGADFTCATVSFDGGAQHPLARSLPAMMVVPLRLAPSMDMALALLFAEADQVQCGHRLVADKLFEVLMLQLLRWLLNHADAAGVPPGLFQGLAHPRLSKALVALHDAPGEPWSLARLADVAGMSRSAFAASFKAVVGETPADYLTDWRLSLAQTALQEGRPVKTIAPELGYATASALSRVFAQRLGCSPREWLADRPLQTQPEPQRQAPSAA
ncbi:MAG: AraC family transcriptional regulator [Acidobacteriota bacterium]